MTRPDAAFDQASSAATRIDLSRRFLAGLVESGDLRLEEQPIYGAMRLERGSHVHTGLLAAVPVDSTLAGRVRRHERIHEDKLEDRARHIREIAAHSGLVMLMHRACPRIDGLLEALTRCAADACGVTPDGTRHSLWLVRAADDQRAIDEAYAALEALYIADGHHRTAAAARIAAETGQGAFPGVLFPAEGMRVLGYHRLVTDADGVSPSQLLARLAEHFEVSPAPRPVVPTEPTVFGLRADGRWYRLAYRGASGSPAMSTDLLDRSVLQPLLRITPESRAARLRYVGGENGPALLEREVDRGFAVMGFTVAPVDCETIMRIADAGKVLPQKSTWFEPKLADGLVVLPLDESDLGRWRRQTHKQQPGPVAV